MRLKKIVKTLMEFFHKIKFLTENTINYDVTFGVINHCAQTY